MMHWVGPAIALLLLAGVVGVVLWWVGFFLLYAPWKAWRISRAWKRGLCPTCGGRLVGETGHDPDQMYGSRQTRTVCVNGHVYKGGNRRFAEW